MLVFDHSKKKKSVYKVSTQCKQIIVENHVYI